MATEKTWQCVQNVDINGSDLLDCGKRWNFEFFNALSGGCGGSVGAWEVVSASNSVTVAKGGTNITAYTDFVPDGHMSNHSWVVYKKVGMLPPTGSMGERPVYIIQNYSDTDGDAVVFSYTYEYPDFGEADETTAPSPTGHYYQKADYVIRPDGYSEGNKTYFSLTIDTTGSFYQVTSQAKVGSNNYGFAMGVIRLETPRSSSYDPFPVYIKQGSEWPGLYGKGPWTFYTNSDSNKTRFDYTYGGSSAMWVVNTNDPTGSANVAFFNVWLNAFPWGGQGYYNPWCDNAYYGSYMYAGAPPDNAWEMVPMFVFSYGGSTAGDSMLRGRLPDLHLHNDEHTRAATPFLAGSVVPATGTPTHCSMCGTWLPFTASILPGN